jgi:hypothetical protein
MRVERGQHAVDGRLDQLFVGHLLDILPAHPLEYFAEQVESPLIDRALLERCRDRRLGRLCGGRLLRICRERRQKRQRYGQQYGGFGSGLLVVHAGEIHAGVILCGHEPIRSVEQAEAGDPVDTIHQSGTRLREPEYG